MIDQIETFKYLGSFVQNNGGFDEEVKHSIKLREASCVLCHERILIKLIGKFY